MQNSRNYRILIALAALTDNSLLQQSFLKVGEFFVLRITRQDRIRVDQSINRIGASPIKPEAMDAFGPGVVGFLKSLNRSPEPRLANQYAGKNELFANPAAGIKIAEDIGEIAQEVAATRFFQGKLRLQPAVRSWSHPFFKGCSTGEAILSMQDSLLRVDGFKLSTQLSGKIAPLRKKVRRYHRLPSCFLIVALPVLPDCCAESLHRK